MGVAAWTRMTAAWDMDGVEEGPDPDGSDCDKIPASALLFGMHARA
jgi:hypothetical protein